MPRAPLPALLLLLAARVAAADPLAAHAARVVEYDIAVRLDAAKKSLAGHERLVWRNPSQDAVGELWFHLYLNAFRNSQSTFFRESGGRLRREQASDDGWGAIDVKSLRTSAGAELLARAVFEHPDDDNALDRTVLRVPLAEPVPPGGTLTLELDFEARLPEVFARTGYRRDFFLAGQWFPKLGVLEPAGTRGRARTGWNCHQFHAHSEFYADYGRYHVEITAPAAFVVGATGRRVALRKHADGTQTHVYEQDDVHDFAWAADPGFVELRRRFVARERVTPEEYAEAGRLLGRSAEELRLSDVEIVMLAQPNHLTQARQQIDVLLEAIERFGLWYGPYPYETVTVVDPPRDARGAFGMEYPTFFTAGTSFQLGRWPFDRLRLQEEVVAHEYGHQYWYGLVGSNEFEESWLDEGLNTFSTSRLLDRLFGAQASSGEILGLRLGQLEQERMSNHHGRRFDRIRTEAWRFSTGQYGFNSYTRPGLVLRTLENTLGPETLARVLRTYAERWRYRHPNSDDFYAVASEVAGRDLRPLLRELIEGRGVLDYAVTKLESRPSREPRGILEQAGRERRVSAQEAQRLEDEAAKGGRRVYDSHVELRRLGELALPVEVELRFAGRAPERRGWDGGEPFVRWTFERGARLLAVEIDPERKLVLDANWLNNSRRLERDGRAAAAWSTRLLFWLQQALALVAL